jgi:hypothetical protein
MAPNPYASGVFYTTCSVIEVGCVLYADNPLVTPVTDNKYSDGVFCYEVFGGNGVVISKTSIDYCFATTSTTTTTTTTTPSGYYLQTMYVLPYIAENPYYWCNEVFEEDLQNVYISNQDPTTLDVGDYLSLSESTCQNSFNGLPITNYVFLWINPNNITDRR